MTSSRKLLRAVVSAADDGTLVKLSLSPKHAAPIKAFIVGVGSKWILGVSVVDGHFDGHVAVRLGDVVRLRRDTSFQTRKARTLPEWPPALETEADLDSTSGALRWFGSRYPLIGIEKAHERSALWIGALGASTGKWVQLHEVDARAEWKLSPLYYRRGAVTQISGGGRYLLALASIAGPQPTIDASRADA